MEKLIRIECSWCGVTYEGEEAEAAADGWFQLQHEALEQPRDYCSTDCLISDL